MEFKVFKELLQTHVAAMLQGHTALYQTDTDKDKLWEAYFESFPAGTNEIYRKRREFDCNCCRHFLKSFGNVVTINNDGDISSIWDFQTNDPKYQPVIDQLSTYVKSVDIKNAFVTKVPDFGTDKSRELNDSIVHTWEHFRIELPKQFVFNSDKSEASLMGEFRAVKDVLKRSLEEISKDAIETVLDLIAQSSLYKGDEWQQILIQFIALHQKYHNLREKRRDNYCWLKAVELGGAIGKIRNHSIGVLLIDISNGMELDDAVKRYEKIVAPTNYKRPKAIFTKKMLEQAENAATELGFINSLGRRFATIEDITINNVLFANKDTLKQMEGGVFQDLEKEVTGNVKKFSKVEEVEIDHFINNILPRTTNIEVYFENRHIPSLISVIAPNDKKSSTMFKWNNAFSWAYNGNITDSMKERVKAAGGNVEGVLRFSVQWNENHDNQNDFDAHCIEPNLNEIYFSSYKKPRIAPSTGQLDVDIIRPNEDQVAVENITWTAIDKMQEGIYKFFVHNYSYRGGRSGFKAEIEYAGQIYAYEYNKELRQDEVVVVAKLKFSRQHGIEFIDSLSSSLSSRTEWGIQTNQFHPVSMVMLSPNYWDNQKGIGHKHYFFILGGCINNSQPNGFFNEFLKEDLMQHKRVFEALGSKMRVQPSDNQLSGLGFSSTKRNSLVCRLEGYTSRIIKITF